MCNKQTLLIIYSPHKVFLFSNKISNNGHNLGNYFIPLKISEHLEETRHDMALNTTVVTSDLSSNRLSQFDLDFRLLLNFYLCRALSRDGVIAFFGKYSRIFYNNFSFFLLSLGILSFDLFFQLLSSYSIFRSYNRKFQEFALHILIHLYNIP